jgi:hypothetical protein
MRSAIDLGGERLGHSSPAIRLADDQLALASGRANCRNGKLPATTNSPTERGCGDRYCNNWRTDDCG